MFEEAECVEVVVLMLVVLMSAFVGAGPEGLLEGFTASEPQLNNLHVKMCVNGCVSVL